MIVFSKSRVAAFSCASWTRSRWKFQRPPLYFEPNCSRFQRRFSHTFNDKPNVCFVCRSSHSNRIHSSNRVRPFTLSLTAPHESPFTFSFPELIYRHSTCSGLSPSHSPEYSVTFTPLRFLSFSTPKLKTHGHLHERTLCHHNMKLKRKCESLSLHRASYTWYFKTDKVFGPDVS